MSRGEPRAGSRSMQSLRRFAGAGESGPLRRRGFPAQSDLLRRQGRRSVERCRRFRSIRVPVSAGASEQGQSTSASRVFAWFGRDRRFRSGHRPGQPDRQGRLERQKNRLHSDCGRGPLYDALLSRPRFECARMGQLVSPTDSVRRRDDRGHHIQRERRRGYDRSFYRG